MKGDYRMSKNKKGIKAYFCGGNAMDVTGSCIYIEMPERKILLDCGIVALVLYYQ
jgi:predicted metal-dependent RNase